VPQQQQQELQAPRVQHLHAGAVIATAVVAAAGASGSQVESQPLPNHAGDTPTGDTTAAAGDTAAAAQSVQPGQPHPARPVMLILVGIPGSGEAAAGHLRR
jgi:hypothetical protein